MGDGLGPSLTAMDGGDGPIDFACPRCGTAAHARFYGPCQPCRDHLVAVSGTAGRALDATRFEPVLHVVPNQVATKE